MPLAFFLLVLRHSRGSRADALLGRPESNARITDGSIAISGADDSRPPPSHPFMAASTRACRRPSSSSARTCSSPGGSCSRVSFRTMTCQPNLCFDRGRNLAHLKREGCGLEARHHHAGDRTSPAARLSLRTRGLRSSVPFPPARRNPSRGGQGSSYFRRLAPPASVSNRDYGLALYFHLAGSRKSPPGVDARFIISGPCIFAFGDLGGLADPCRSSRGRKERRGVRFQGPVPPGVPCSARRAMAAPLLHQLFQKAIRTTRCGRSLELCWGQPCGSLTFQL